MAQASASPGSNVNVLARLPHALSQENPEAIDLQTPLESEESWFIPRMP